MKNIQNRAQPSLVHRPIFLHIPKTGGTAVFLALGHNIIYSSHCSIKVYKRSLPFFSFTRNPLDRIVSAYFYLKSSGLFGIDKKDRDKYIKDLSFEDFIHKVGENPSFYLQQIHLVPQVNFVKYEDGSINFENIGKYENLEKDFKDICLRLKLPKVELPRMNTSHHPYYKTLYNKRMINIVADVYKEDFEAFGYNY